MDSTMQAVLQFVEENDVKFIRLAFCDVMGTLKNIAIMPSELPRAFETGVSFDASSILGFAPVDKSDLFLFPDAATLSVLPWRPQTGRVVRFFCSVRTADGSPYGADGRHILRRTLRRLADAGYECRVGAECEFYLFERDAEGRPTKCPQDNGGYFDVAPLDRGENVRREICLTLEEMNIRPESSHHEQGPGQNEVDFKHAAPLTAADDVITFKNVVKTVAARNGLYGSFSPKPLADKPGSGMHVNISLARGGRNIFAPGPDGAYSPAMRSFIAGVLARAGEICAFTNPVPGSYARFGSFEAPRYVAWSHQNRSQLIRIPAAPAPEYARIEVRMPDVSCNPYLAFALLLAAGFEGMERKMELAEETPYDLYTANAGALEALPMLYKTLPSMCAMMAALSLLRKSGAMEAFTGAVSPALQKAGMPGELVPLFLLRPFSGSAALAILRDIFDTCGADSFVGVAASVMLGSTETVFYTVSVYLGSAGVTKPRYCIAASLGAAIVGAASALVLARMAGV